MILSLLVVAVCLVVAIAVAIVVIRRVRGDSVVDVVSFTPSSPPPAPPVRPPVVSSEVPTSFSPARPAPSVTLDSAQESEIRALIAAGNMIGAIKRMREFAEIGLADAKRVVEDMQQGVATILRPEPVPQPTLAAYASADREVQLALARGNKIEAIKRVRELTGMGLKEAKDVVEALETGRAVPSASPRSAPASDFSDVRALAVAGRKIEAIKRYRELTGVGLKEAKEYVEGLL